MNRHVLAPMFLASALICSPPFLTEARGQDDKRDVAATQFIDSYAAFAPVSGRLARWQGEVCAGVFGLDTATARIVTERVKEISKMVGAKTPANDACDLNVRVIFSDDPQKIMDQIRAASPDDLGYYPPGGAEDVATVRHPIQAWYVTGTVDQRGMVLRDGPATAANMCTGDDVRNGRCRTAAKGGLLGSGASTILAGVTIVVNTKMFGVENIREVADYVAMLTLAPAKSFSSCRDLPSITNLTSLGCDLARRATAISENDLAYLRAVYKTDPKQTPAAQRRTLISLMAENLAKPSP
jgi:hypothetical protein